MRVAYITAGAAGMYCGSCLHDNTLAAALQRQGHDVSLIPTYTPIRTDEDDVSIDRVFYGALNVYLETRWRPFRKMPEWLHRALDRPAVLALVSRFAGSAATRGSDLGALTLGVLQGERGPAAGELERLLDWLRREEPADVVHLTNAMFLGLAGPLRRETGAPVVCSLQGEDLFLEDLIEPWRGRVLEELRRQARQVDGFIATSHYYADFMARYLRVPRERIAVVRLGITLDGHEPAPGSRGFVVGYLARQAPEKGLHHLVEAFRLLVEGGGPREPELHVAGYTSPKDRDYVRGLQEKLRELGLADRVRWHGEVDRAGKMRFLRGLDVFSVPTVYRESKGLPVLEAMASGVPVVQPDHGSFPEIVAATGGGILVRPEDPEALAAGLRRLMEDDEHRRRLGRRGRDVVHASYSDARMAEETVAAFERFRELAHRAGAGAAT